MSTRVHGRGGPWPELPPLDMGMLIFRAYATYSLCSIVLLLGAPPAGVIDTDLRPDFHSDFLADLSSLGPSARLHIVPRPFFSLDDTSVR